MMMRLVVLAILSCCITAQDEQEPQTGYQLHPYQVTYEGPDFEVRLLPTWTWVCSYTNETVRNRKNSRALSFKIFGYTEGKNERGLEIKKTPTKFVVSEEGFTMCTMMPAETQADPPLPIGEDVFLDTQPSRTVAVRKIIYNEMNQSVWVEGANKLKASLEADGIADFDSHPFYRVVLDRPGFHVPAEVWFEQKEDVSGYQQTQSSISTKDSDFQII
ncbi:heme-binding protein 2-like [Oratosquilla oratoria]|uniref:heme-binding protein 2-like n=1 Tax=Oratosquilla oratoria TaxID=337810 RepID=UPI003F767A89